MHRGINTCVHERVGRKNSDGRLPPQTVRTSAQMRLLCRRRERRVGSLYHKRATSDDCFKNLVDFTSFVNINCQFLSRRWGYKRQHPLPNLERKYELVIAK